MECSAWELIDLYSNVTHNSVFCNGSLITDFISEAFGIPAYLDPAYGIKDFATGVTFASAGSGYDNLTAGIASVIPLWKQLEFFKNYERNLVNFMGMANANKMLREALYFISIGTNDFIINYYSLPQGRRTQFRVEEYENYLLSISENFVRNNYQLGARKIALAGLPPFGCLPTVRTTTAGGSCKADYNNVARTGRNYNAKLKILIAKLKMELIGMRLLYTDFYNPLLQIINNPKPYGFEVVATGCCGTGTYEMGYLCREYDLFSCKDTSKYIFWDAIHPSDKLYRIVADYLMKTTFAQLL
ncbi:hypothetical protein AQUCO_02800064v1 [Aquilegia coerulea]|uniref:Uncharacterized protein n=1 Tax=Aquilegia coerulea TaxID=218851 RepID=A0A2G5D3R0_AQUCA|nr:hypothetical protein AQUCO_02800064v1 [Aquilegia coerulea]